jgi:hypothetical protein
MGNMFRIFMIFVILMIVFTAVRFLTMFRRTTERGAANSSGMAKRCVSCGRNIDTAAHSCPRCYAIQPPSRDQEDANRKK